MGAIYVNMQCMNFVEDYLLCSLLCVCVCVYAGVCRWYACKCTEVHVCCATPYGLTRLLVARQIYNFMNL